MRGARIVFHPQHTGTEQAGVRLTEWGSPGAPYYEKAMMMRSIENTIYFASVNYALRFQESATSLITPYGPMPGVPALRAGRGARANHQGGGGHRVARHALRPRPSRYREFGEKLSISPVPHAAEVRIEAGSRMHLIQIGAR